jgi:hypothetical protein
LTDLLGHSSTESTPILVVARPLAIVPTSSAIDPTLDARVYLGILTDLEGDHRRPDLLGDGRLGRLLTAATVDPLGSLDGVSIRPAVLSIVASPAYAQAGDYTAKVSFEDNPGDFVELTSLPNFGTAAA